MPYGALVDSTTIFYKQNTALLVRRAGCIIIFRLFVDAAILHVVSVISMACIAVFSPNFCQCLEQRYTLGSKGQMSSADAYRARCCASVFVDYFAIVFFVL